MNTPTLEQSVDQAAYETLQRHNPDLLKRVERCVTRGLTPHRVYLATIRWGFPAMTASLCWCVAGYIQKQAVKQ